MLSHVVQPQPKSGQLARPALCRRSGFETLSAPGLGLGLDLSLVLLRGEPGGCLVSLVVSPEASCLAVLPAPKSHLPVGMQQKRRPCRLLTQAFLAPHPRLRTSCSLSVHTGVSLELGQLELGMPVSLSACV
jgi:hypothetical protein